KRDKNSDFFISKNLAYDKGFQSDMTFADALHQVIRNMEVNNLTDLHGETEIFIYPGYKIRTAHGLFTNFHLPKSTLLALVGAFAGMENMMAGKEALAKDYRFLSYGDSSLLLR
ncbi:MAG: S-adenosylmethionine:tRNA ribosyltransferase-isomerase, partial [Cyclobacteriaceae bacterium]|nr:S-adenosylmethionine:tRNA ribosyltransferase-isomerase [Cyclobacteriaceae bacterium]